MELQTLPNAVEDALSARREADGVLVDLARACACEHALRGLRVKKSLNGLRQAAKQRQAKLKTLFGRYRHVQSSTHPCMFYEYARDGSRIYAHAYINYIVLAAKKRNECKTVVKTLRSELELRATDDAHYILGLRIEPKPACTDSYCISRGIRRQGSREISALWKQCKRASATRLDARESDG